MSQSRTHSLIEAILNNAASFAIAFLVNLMLMAWLVARYDRATAALVQTLIFSAISIVRQYVLLRFFNWLHVHKERDEKLARGLCPDCDSMLVLKELGRAHCPKCQPDGTQCPHLEVIVTEGGFGFCDHCLEPCNFNRATGNWEAI